MVSGSNLILATLRRPRNEMVYNFWVGNAITDKCVISSLDNANIFPLYPTEQTSLFDTNEPTDAPGNRRPNLAPEFVQDFSSRLGMGFIADGKGDRENNFAPEDIFDYMYAVFHSPTYRSRYAEFLKIDFPRLPLTSNPDLFRRLTQLGSRLVKLHLMEETGVEIATFPESGNNTVEKIRYSEPQRRVWINKTQYFEGVPRKFGTSTLAVIKSVRNGSKIAKEGNFSMTISAITKMLSLPSRKLLVLWSRLMKKSKNVEAFRFNKQLVLTRLLV